jgi:hypothetical protein
MALAREWLKSCSTKHSCFIQKTTHSPWYPTRLIKIGRNKSSKLEARLCLPEEETMEGPYCTLSHCWGSKPLLTLTRPKLDDYLKTIPHDALPQTFQDTIAVVFALEIHYPWIDSLCILQSGEGSLEDWLNESAKMQEVYANSYCNIGALSVNDSTKSMFESRDPADVFIPTVEVNWLRFASVSSVLSFLPAIRERLRMGVRVHAEGRFTLVDYSFWQGNVPSQPLLQRSWVFQERMLCPRMLHFRNNQRCWECRESTACESWPGVGMTCIGDCSPQSTNTKHKMEVQRKYSSIWMVTVVETCRNGYYQRS